MLPWGWTLSEVPRGSATVRNWGKHLFAAAHPPKSGESDPADARVKKASLRASPVSTRVSALRRIEACTATGTPHHCRATLISAPSPRLQMEEITTQCARSALGAPSSVREVGHGPLWGPGPGLGKCCASSATANRVVLETKAGQQLGLIEVAPVEDKRHLQRFAHRLEVGCAEFLPLGRDQ